MVGVIRDKRIVAEQKKLAMPHPRREEEQRYWKKD
jgi:hypothetical protein